MLLICFVVHNGYELYKIFLLQIVINIDICKCSMSFVNYIHAIVEKHNIHIRNRVLSHFNCENILTETKCTNCIGLVNYAIMMKYYENPGNIFNYLSSYSKIPVTKFSMWKYNKILIFLLKNELQKLQIIVIIHRAFFQC